MPKPCLLYFSLSCLVVICCGDPAFAQSGGAPERFYYFHPDSSGRYARFEYRKSDIGTPIDLGNLRVSLPPKGFFSWYPNYDLRSQLLGQNLAIDPDHPPPPPPPWPDPGKSLRPGATPEKSTPPKSEASRQEGSPPQPSWFSRIGLFFSDLARHASDHATIVISWAKTFAGEHLKSAISLGAIIGIFGFFRRRYVYRKMAVVVLGDISSGKTVLMQAMTGVSERAGSRPTEKTTKHKGLTILNGSSEFTPNFHDTPGKRQGEGLDAIGQSSWLDWLVIFPKIHAILYVLAPARGTEAAPNQSFLDVQLGMLRSHLSAQLDSKGRRRPKAAILFINKADLLQNGGNSVSEETENRLLKIFEDHISHFNSSFGRAKVNSRVVTGSALRGWDARTLPDLLVGLARS